MRRQNILHTLHSDCKDDECIPLSMCAHANETLQNNSLNWGIWLNERLIIGECKKSLDNRCFCCCSCCLSSKTCRKLVMVWKRDHPPQTKQYSWHMHTHRSMYTNRQTPSQKWWWYFSRILRIEESSLAKCCTLHASKTTHGIIIIIIAPTMMMITMEREMSKPMERKRKLFNVHSDMIPTHGSAMTDDTTIEAAWVFEVKWPLNFFSKCINCNQNVQIAFSNNIKHTYRTHTKSNEKQNGHTH